jgi:NADPH:quinone reductase
VPAGTVPPVRLSGAARSVGRMTKHWVAPRFGGSEVLEFTDTEVPAPGPGEVTIAVRAAGMNPADTKHTRQGDPSDLPIAVGYEVAGTIRAVGPDTEIASGGGAVGDEVLAFRVEGGWTEELTVPARDVFAKPATLGFPEAANLLLAGTTAADMLRVTRAAGNDTVLVHGAAGAVGVSLLQQLRLLGARVIGTASERNADVVADFGGEWIAYGDGLEDRVRALVGDGTGDGVSVALDCVGTDEAVDVSLALVADRSRIVTIAAFGRAESDGIRAVGGAQPESKAFRESVRQRLIDLAGEGQLVVPVARTFPLAEAKAAAELLESQHPGGKLALVP